MINYIASKLFSHLIKLLNLDENTVGIFVQNHSDIPVLLAVGLYGQFRFDFDRLNLIFRHYDVGRSSIL